MPNVTSLSDQHLNPKYVQFIIILLRKVANPCNWEEANILVFLPDNQPKQSNGLQE